MQAPLIFPEVCDFGCFDAVFHDRRQRVYSVEKLGDLEVQIELWPQEDGTGFIAFSWLAISTAFSKFLSL